MEKKSLFEQAAIFLGIKADQISPSVVRNKIPELKRTVEKFERIAAAAEEAASANRKKAFAPETPPASRKQFLKQSMADAAKATRNAGYAANFLSILDNFLTLDTMMQITSEMKDFGLITTDESTKEWRHAVESMQDEMQMMKDQMHRLGDLMKCALDQTTSLSDGNVADEIDRLFDQYNAETDPVKREEIKARIDAKTNILA